MRDHWDITVTFDSGLVVHTTASSLEDLHTCLVILRDRHPGDGDIIRIEAS